MAKKQGGGELLPLPFTTFGEAAAHGLKPAFAWSIHGFTWRPSYWAASRQLDHTCGASLPPERLHGVNKNGHEV
jgi:hypothetical protein